LPGFLRKLVLAKKLGVLAHCLGIGLDAFGQFEWLVDQRWFGWRFRLGRGFRNRLCDWLYRYRRVYRLRRLSREKRCPLRWRRLYRW
jgi:hypothetical protein